jgi:DNA-binding XRE family transcriptional regulator
MGIQKIKAPNGDRLVVLPESEYEELLDRLDEAAAVLAVERFERKLATGEEEFVPADVVDRILAGENKVAIWREYRGLTARELAEKAGITQAYLSQIESGKRDGTIGTMKKIAEALSVTIDELV